jgi:hypothetical protein
MSCAHVFLPLPLPPPAHIAEAGAPCLAQLVARARFSLADPAEPTLLEARLFGAFGLPAAPDALPAAALTALLDGLDPAVHPLRADPVCLRADLVDVALLPGHPPGLTLEQAQALVAEVNTRLGDGGLRLAVGQSPLRWYVAAEGALEIRALPPRAVAGRGTREHLPTGKDRRRLLGWLTEVQFVLHASPVNAERASQGLPPVNSLWLWGGDVAAAADGATSGEASRAALDAQAGRAKVFAECALTRGLARAAGVAPAVNQPLSALAAAAAAMPPGEALLVVDDPGPGMALDLAAAEQAWAVPLLAALRRGRLRQVVLDTPEGRHSLGRLGLLQFWKRP